MDKQSHYTWTLTRDELADVWFALTHYADYWEKKAKQAEEIERNGGTPRGLTSDECWSQARKHRELYGQINRMRHRW